MWNPLSNWLSPKPLSNDEFEKAKADLLKKAPIPVLWLFGKTGSGKSSIVRYLTGVEAIEIGQGFRPQTQYSSRYDFPSSSEPILTFLDTRGIGEAGYKPEQDIAEFSDIANLIVVPVRVMDHALNDLLSALKAIRQQTKTLPVLLVFSTLHEAYPGEQHPEEYPYSKVDTDGVPTSIPEPLQRVIKKQLENFKGLYDAVVPLDLTPDFEGFEQPEFGGDKLKEAILELLPAAYRHNLLQIDEVVSPLKDKHHKKTRSTILGISGLAAAAAAVPVPWIDIPVVIGLQTHLIYKLAKLHGQQIDAATIAQVTSAIGSRLVIRMAIREFLKVIPWIGMTVNAASAFVVTYAQGMAWNWYFLRVQEGHVPSNEELKDVFKQQFQKASELWKTTHQTDSNAT